MKKKTQTLLCTLKTGVPFQEAVKLLGFWLDSKLSWNDHLSKSPDVWHCAVGTFPGCSGCIAAAEKGLKNLNIIGPRANTAGPFLWNSAFSPYTASTSSTP
ncbi:uncharacterized protein LOC124374116, partial [Homalodisca vitripennis]|uniref:uncharacterized protein LOC124374116 n=1 Tax=Homalodisca vitripennis TaxID=197043 RepID=UPI001EECD1CF